MSPVLAAGIVVGYFILLIIISHFSSRNTSDKTFFIANKESHWFLVAFGMVGASLSGITYISVPGEVAVSQFSYFQLVIGYILGILIIAVVLLPLYYRLNLYSIYEYLGTRFGYWSHKTGAAYFLVAQTMYAAFKLYLMATVLQLAIFDAFHLPFAVTVFTILVVIWLYTYRSGIKTVIYTDTLQTAFLLLAVIFSIFTISTSINLSISNISNELISNSHTKIFVWDWSSKNNFFKLVLTGALLTVVTNGLDQSVMQKHLTCRSLKDSWKNMFWFSVMLLISNIMFLVLGLMLVLYADAMAVQLPEKTDEIYPLLALQYLGGFTGLLFLLGISAAAFSSADSALTGLTTSFCVDFLGYKHTENSHPPKLRNLIHLGLSLILFVVLMFFDRIHNTSMIRAFVSYSGFTYGPLLGLYTFGLFTRFKITDSYVPIVCVISPLLCIVLKSYSAELFWGYQLEYEILVINGAITCVGLLLLHLHYQFMNPGLSKQESTT